MLNDQADSMHSKLKYKKRKHEILCHKKKFKRYTNLQKSIILSEYFSNKNVKQISNKYKASASSIYKFIRESNQSFKNI